MQKVSVTRLEIQWEVKESMLMTFLNSRSLARIFYKNHVDLLKIRDEDTITSAYDSTDQMGKQKLWKGYKQKGAVRAPSLVSTVTSHGRFFYKLATHIKPRIIIELGSAFGISGMYWLSAIKANGLGHLYTYEVNKEWAIIANKNLNMIDDNYVLTNDLFESRFSDDLDGRQAEIAFIDGIHTMEWVLPQFNTIANTLKRDGVIVLDDINFSPDMRRCWKKIITDHRVKNAFLLDDSVGVVQLS